MVLQSRIDRRRSKYLPLFYAIKGVPYSDSKAERGAAAPLRQALQAEAHACLRFETPPGKQLQIDFGATTTSVGGERVRLHLFVATLGYSRRPFVGAFRHERQSAWFDGIEGAFERFGGVPRARENARCSYRSIYFSRCTSPRTEAFRFSRAQLSVGIIKDKRHHQDNSARSV